MTPVPEPRLWVCDRCELVGSETEAETHMEETGHAIEQLTQAISDAFRARQHEERVNRFAGLMMLGRMSRAQS